ncbi:MAG: PQQ-dependent sugar dehydrogenase [Acidimicrobiia bacterium]
MRLRLLFLLLWVAQACSPVGGPPEATTSAPATLPPSGRAPATTSAAPATTPSLPPLQGLALETVAEGLSNPLLVTAPAGDPRLFVVEKVGRVRIVAEAELLSEPFLDISSLVRDSGEQGFLGLAFHPAYADNGLFFVHYSDRNGDTAVVEYRVSDDPSRADPESARLLLSVEQPAPNHNGGTVSFGPDGYLYLGLGDGGGAGDRFGHGQDPGTLLATLLRLDVDQGDPYAIPPDNPFVDGGGAPEVWAYGLRNPWRFAFDEGLVYIADVGQNAWEEIDVAPADQGGLNYGWPIMEGTHCFREANCDTAGLVQPVLEYPIPADGCAVIGGSVYRGRAIPELAGHYFYGDLCGGWIRSFRYQDGRAVEQAEHLTGVGSILSFGTDSQGELYVGVAGGTVSRLVGNR